MNKIKPVCLKCSIFNSKNDENYRCAIKGECPGLDYPAHEKTIYEKSIKSKSKFLSLVLRHKPEKAHIELDRGGWADIAQLLHSTGWETSELDIVIETDDKKRFEFDNTYTKIRACQGHSIDVDLALKPLTPPVFLYHGTSIENYNAINKSGGIQSMNRQFVHLSDDVVTACEVGKRHGKPVVLEINTIAMVDDGNEFYLSNNGVWLTAYVDKKYITNVFE